MKLTTALSLVFVFVLLGCAKVEVQELTPEQKRFRAAQQDLTERWHVNSRYDRDLDGNLSRSYTTMTKYPSTAAVREYMKSQGGDVSAKCLEMKMLYDRLRADNNELPEVRCE